MTPDQYRDALKKARAEAAKSRVDSKRLAELEANQLTDAEKRDKELADAQARAASAEERAQRVGVRAEAKLVARELGINMELALELLNFKDIEFDESGDPKNVAALLKAKVEKYGIAPSSSSASAASQQPHVSSGGAVNPSRTSNSNNGLFDGDPQTVMKRISKLAPSEYLARGLEIQAYIDANWNKISGR
jgi:multidrug efflux pump subunit AcrA (membrane-fusion protein)